MIDILRDFIYQIPRNSGSPVHIGPCRIYVIRCIFGETPISPKVKIKGTPGSGSLAVDDHQRGALRVPQVLYFAAMLESLRTMIG